jgi:release factor glutamine methyltransferase
VTSPAASIDTLLAEAQRMGVERQDALAWLAHATGRDRAWLFAHGDEPAPPEAQAGLARLAAGEHLAHLTGWQPFRGLMLAVTPDVLVPRPDTETLVEWALELAPPGASVADLGTGSGAIALTLKAARPDLAVTATDLSPAALAVARANGERLGLAVNWRQGSWLTPLAGDAFDLIVSNPPYIAGDDPHLASLTHEPLGALTPGGDGLADLAHLSTAAPAHLRPGGWLLMEHGWDQADAVQRQLAQTRFTQVTSRQDLGGRPRCTGGRWRG